MGPHLRGGPNAPDLSKFHGMSASIRDEAISASIRDDTYTRANSTVLHSIDRPGICAKS